MFNIMFCLFTKVKKLKRKKKHHLQNAVNHLFSLVELQYFLRCQDFAFFYRQLCLLMYCVFHPSRYLSSIRTKGVLLSMKRKQPLNFGVSFKSWLT